MKRHVCIHGHFYQPPRENPWLEEIEVQDSAYPYHDWNQRVTSDCYKPNTASRILDREGRIVDIINNYSRISFNFGPTILSWLKAKEPQVYQAILEADKMSIDRYSGHGSALAQCYNHLIMPLAGMEDKKTQVIWGIRDFENRYDRKPEGMWLPETAVDIETLEILAEMGIRFTILSQHQAARVRKIGDEEWMEFGDNDEKVDPKKPYSCNLPSGRKITIFYYDMITSKAVAFENLLNSGEDFAHRLMDPFTDDEEEINQIVSIATDGESYGHHHPHGEMALSYCLYHIESTGMAEITNFSRFLKENPPKWETEIIENTSWSCSHGIERWRSDCGCSTGGKHGWNQSWRGPLREALDWLKEKIDGIFLEKMEGYTEKPWSVRNDYIDVIMDRSDNNVVKFIRSHFGEELMESDQRNILRLLEMERNGMLMYTSCGWFFSELSGIETVQVMMYAGRALQLAEIVNAVDLETGFLERLKEAKSNMKLHGDGARIYEKFVKPARLDLLRVCGHYAISSIFREYYDSFDLYFYNVEKKFLEIIPMGKLSLALGRVRIRSRITWEAGEFSFAVLHLGDHNIIGGVQEGMKFEDFKVIAENIRKAFQKTDVPQILRLIDGSFRDHNYSLWHLFRDEQRSVFTELLMPTIKEAEEYYRQSFEEHFPVIIVMKELNIPLPKHLIQVVELVVNIDLVQALSEEYPDLERLERIINVVERCQPDLDVKNLSLISRNRVKSELSGLSEEPENLELLERIVGLLELLDRLEIDIHFWEAQNILFKIKVENYERVHGDLKDEGRIASRWLDLFHRLGSELGVKI